MPFTANMQRAQSFRWESIATFLSAPHVGLGCWHIVTAVHEGKEFLVDGKPTTEAKIKMPVEFSRVNLH